MTEIRSQLSFRNSVLRIPPREWGYFTNETITDELTPHASIIIWYLIIFYTSSSIVNYPRCISSAEGVYYSVMNICENAYCSKTNFSVSVILWFTCRTPRRARLSHLHRRKADATLRCCAARKDFGTSDTGRSFGCPLGSERARAVAAGLWKYIEDKCHRICSQKKRYKLLDGSSKISELRTCMLTTDGCMFEPSDAFCIRPKRLHYYGKSFLSGNINN